MPAPDPRSSTVSPGRAAAWPSGLPQPRPRFAPRGSRRPARRSSRDRAQSRLAAAARVAARGLPLGRISGGGLASAAAGAPVRDLAVLLPHHVSNVLGRAHDSVLSSGFGQLAREREEPARRFGHRAVADAGPVDRSLDPARFLQHLEVLRYRRLGEGDAVHDRAADALAPREQEAQDPHPSGMPERLPEARQLRVVAQLPAFVPASRSGVARRGPCSASWFGFPPLNRIS